ncbi:MAG: hypothetical protein AB7F28_05715 [Candidatus Margulisiibacteriota bacterium]
MTQFVSRIGRAMRLDVSLFEAVEADKKATAQALLVVVLAAIAGGIGAEARSLLGILTNIGVNLLAWFVWAGLTSFIGTKLLPEPQTKSDLGELLRTVGFASAPGILRVFGLVLTGFLNQMLFAVVSVWMLVAMVIAVRQALDYKGTARAILVCLVGWLVQVAMVLVSLFMLGKML